jgi:hypothetical protein
MDVSLSPISLRLLSRLDSGMDGFGAAGERGRIGQPVSSAVRTIPWMMHLQTSLLEDDRS